SAARSVSMPEWTGRSNSARNADEPPRSVAAVFSCDPQIGRRQPERRAEARIQKAILGKQPPEPEIWQVDEDRRLGMRGQPAVTQSACIGDHAGRHLQRQARPGYRI